MNQEFVTHKLSQAGIEKVNDVKKGFDILLDGLKQLCPESRHFSVTKTKLEEACFFAVKSVASEPANWQPEEAKAA